MLLLRSILVAVFAAVLFLFLSPSSSSPNAAVESAFTPAAGFHALTAWYDLAVRWTCREEVFRPLLAIDIARSLSGAAVSQPTGEAAASRPAGGKPLVVEIGAGTGSLTLELASALDGVAILGVEPDAQSREIAAAKVAAFADVSIVEGFGQSLPVGNGTASALVSSLVFHHLTRDNKLKTLREGRRVLVPGGTLHIADWGGATTWLDSLCFVPIRLLDGFETTGDGTHGVLPLLMELAGFEGVSEVARVPTVFGPLVVWIATNPM